MVIGGSRAKTNTIHGIAAEPQTLKLFGTGNYVAIYTNARDFRLATAWIGVPAWELSIKPAVDALRCCLVRR